MQVSNFISSKLKISELSVEGQELALVFLVFNMLSTGLVMLTSTFIILHVIDTVGFSGLGVIMATYFIVSALTDYPTGVLADWIGHKWVLSLAYVLFAISSFLLALATQFSGILIAYIVLALANGQASGALQSWFDNNYKSICHESDPKKEIYREFLGVSTKYLGYTGSIVFLFGGFLATVLPKGRIIIFTVQGIGMLASAVLFGLFLNTTENDEKSIDQTDEIDDSSYVTLLLDGLKFSISSKMIFLYVVGSVLFIVVISIWYNLVLFPLYFGYTSSDAGAGAFRWVIWFIGAMLSSSAGVFAKKLNEKIWIPRLALFTVLIFFGFTAIVLSIYPIDTPKQNLLAIFLIFLTFTIGGYLSTAYGLLTQKLYLEIIPDKVRNSFYSLLPTLGLLIAAPIFFVMAGLIDDIGFSNVVVMIVVFAMIPVALFFLALQQYFPEGDQGEMEVDILFDTYAIGNFDPLMFQIPKKWQFSPRVRIIWDQFMEIALEDKQIDESEKSLLSSIMLNLKEYGEVLEKAKEDEVIDENERIELLQLRAKMIQEAETIAADDKLLTLEEEKILDRLMYTIMELQKEELLDTSKTE